MNETELRLLAKEKALALCETAGIVLTEQEKNHVEFCDYGLGDFDRIGTEIIIYVNTKRVCAKELILTPGQICPEHIHPQLGDYPGKEETFRCRKGVCYLYVSGEGKQEDIKAKLPPTTVTVFHEVELKAGEQYTLYPNTRHWFQAGSEGAIISEFSTKSRDEYDIYTDKRIDAAGKRNI